MDPGRAPSIRDVAREAGVSHQTVSRALNGSPRIRPETLERVLAAVEALGYRPNQLARALVTNRSDTIGVLADLSGHHGPAVTLAAIEEAARAAGLRVSVTTPGPGSIRGGLEFLLAQRVEALVVLAPQREVFDALAELPDAVPAIALETAASGGSAIGVDQERGARLAVRHLLDLGHRRIAHVAGPLDWAEARAREAGWRATLADAGIEAGQAVPGDWTAASGAAALDAVLDSGATAVFAANDQTALGLLAAARRRGVSVPDGLSVVGFDDLPESAFFDPPLTTIRQDLGELGRRAVAVLVAELRGGDPDLSSIEPELVIRSSTAPPVR